MSDWEELVAGFMLALKASAEEVLMMDALLACWCTEGAIAIQERAMAQAKRGGKGNGQDEVIDLPDGGKRVRIRTMDGLRAFMKSQQ